MTKATAWVAVIFMVTSLSLAILGTRRGSPTAGSVLNDHVKSAPASAKQPSTSTTTLPPSVTPGAATPTTGAVTPSAPVQIPVTPGTGPVKPGQPSVTLTNPATGESRTVPLNIPPNPAGTQQQTPAKK